MSEPDPPRLQPFRLGSQEDDVAGGTVHVGEPGAMAIPDVAQVAQRLGGVEPAGGLVDAAGVELGHVGELGGQVRVAPDDTAAVAHDAYQAAVLPVADMLLVGPLEHAQEVLDHGAAGFVLDLLDEAGPRPLLEVVEKRGGSLFLIAHGNSFRRLDLRPSSSRRRSVPRQAPRPRSSAALFGWPMVSSDYGVRPATEDPDKQPSGHARSEEQTSELQSRLHLV